MKRTFVFLTALLLLCASVSWVSAAPGDTIQPLWVYVNYVNGTIDISSGGMATVSASTRMKPGKVQKTTITASLQQYEAGRWKEIKSWTASSSGTSAKLSEKNWMVAHGYSYRVLITAKAYAGTTVLEQGSYTANYGYFK